MSGIDLNDTSTKRLTSILWKFEKFEGGGKWKKIEKEKKGCLALLT